MSLIADDELLSTKEVIPRPAEPAPPETRCQHCEWRKAGVGSLQKAWLGQHLKRQHPEHYSAPAKAKAAPRAKAAPKAPAAPKAAKAAPARTTRRSTVGFLGRNLGRMAAFAGHVPVAAPAGRALELSRWSAAIAIDGLIAGTRADRPVQKMASAGEKWERLGNGLGLPAMVLVCSMNPALAPLLEEDMREALAACLVDALPALRRRKERERQVAAALADLGELDPTLKDNPDPIGSLLQGFWAGSVIDPDGPAPDAPTP